MRALVTLGLLALIPVATPAQDKKDVEVEPIPVIKLDRTDPVLYEKEIEPIFKKRCFVCHTGKEKKSKFDISTYEDLMKGGKRGSPVVPGKSQDSLLVMLCGRTKKPYM